MRVCTGDVIGAGAGDTNLGVDNGLGAEGAGAGIGAGAGVEGRPVPGVTDTGAADLTGLGPITGFAAEVAGGRGGTFGVGKLLGLCTDFAAIGAGVFVREAEIAGEGVGGGKGVPADACRGDGGGVGRDDGCKGRGGVGAVLRSVINNRKYNQKIIPRMGVF